MSPARPFHHQVLLLIGSFGPLGHVPASGTVTVAVLGLPLFRVLHNTAGPLYVTIVLAFSIVAVWVHHVGDRLLGERDSRHLVWDELAGFLVAVAFVPFTWQLTVSAFVLERALDMVKIPPAHWIERHWPGGLSVVGDDLVAGLYTCATLHLIMRLTPAWVGLNS